MGVWVGWARDHRPSSPMSTYFCIVTLTNRPAPLYNVGKLQVRLAYVAVFMAPLTAPYYSIAPQVQIRTLTQGRSWYSYSFMVDICHWPQQLWGLKDCLLSLIIYFIPPPPFSRTLLLIWSWVPSRCRDLHICSVPTCHLYPCLSHLSPIMSLPLLPSPLPSQYI